MNNLPFFNHSACFKGLASLYFKVDRSHARSEDSDSTHLQCLPSWIYMRTQQAARVAKEDEHTANMATWTASLAALPKRKSVIGDCD
jgi:hypothetical protein